MSEDITYCGNTKCKVIKCRRNHKNIKRRDILHSFAMLEGSELCPDIPEQTKRREQENE